MLNAEPPFGPQSAVLLPGGDYRLVTVRNRLGDEIMCSEPSPDWAVAFGSALAGSVSGSAAGKASASLSGSSTTTEAVTAMLGRTAGVVALRDGLYSACQAYANGIIGKNAYSLILSQYGNLLVSLAGGNTGSETPRTSSPAATPAGVAVAVSTGTAPAAAPASQGGGGPGQAGNPQVAILQQEAVQAMLVACITESDPTVSHGDGFGNPLLARNCDAFMARFGEALPDLLKPAWTAAVPGARPKANAKGHRALPTT